MAVGPCFQKKMRTDGKTVEQLVEMAEFDGGNNRRNIKRYDDLKQHRIIVNVLRVALGTWSCTWHDTKVLSDGFLISIPGNSVGVVPKFESAWYCRK